MDVTTEQGAGSATTAALAEQVIALISAFSGLPAAEIHPDSLLLEDLGLDSLDAVEMLAELERQAERRFANVEMDEDLTVAEVIERAVNLLAADPS